MAAQVEEQVADQVEEDHRAGEQPFTGELRPLDRVGKVKPETVAVVFTEDEGPVVREPGETLLPGWNPFRRKPLVLPVTTGVVPLTVQITDLITFDRATVSSVTLKICVQVTEADRVAAVARLATTYGPDFGSHLLAELLNKIETGVRAAFRMNSVDDLRRVGVADILESRWLPLNYASGALVRRGVSVMEIAWPDPPPEPSLASALAQSREIRASSTNGRLELSVDAKLRRIWQRWSPVPVRGIAGARISGQATVVAASDVAPCPDEWGRLREGFAELYADPALLLAVVTSSGYEQLVCSWLLQVDAGHARLLGVDELRGGDLLRVRLAAPLPSDRGRRGRPGLAGSEVAALRQLLPHRLVEFTAVATPP